MTEWIKVVTHPIGLVAFSLWLVFFLASRTKVLKNKGLERSFIVMAFISLLGGLGLAYWQTYKSPTTEEHAAPAQSTTTSGTNQNNTSIQQSTEGANSPAVADVKGDVNIILKGQDGSQPSK